MLTPTHDERDGAVGGSAVAGAAGASVPSMAEHNETIVDQFTRQATGFAAAEPLSDARLLGLLVRESGVGPHHRVLDVACGPGIVTCAFAASAESAVGLDLVDAMLDRARERAGALGAGNAQFIAGEATALPFAAAAFDVVVSRFALHHLEDPAAALAEMARVCVDGGTVIVCDVAPEAASAAAFNTLERLRDPSHVRALTENELGALFAQRGELSAPRITHSAIELELESHLARSFPATPADAREACRMLVDSVTDDRLGVGARRHGDRIEYSFPLAVLASNRAARQSEPRER